MPGQPLNSGEISTSVQEEGDISPSKVMRRRGRERGLTNQATYDGRNAVRTSRGLESGRHD